MSNLEESKPNVVESGETGRGWVGFALGLGATLLLLLLALAGLWLAAPAIVEWQLESGLREAGFEEVSVETRGRGWREVGVARISGRLGDAELEVEDAGLSYTLAGLLRGQARSFETERLWLSYAAEEWPGWEALRREFPFLTEEWDTGEGRLADLIRVREGVLSLVVGGAELDVEFALRLETAEADRWEGEVELEGGGVKGVITFETDSGEGRGRWQVLDGRIDQANFRRTWANLLEEELLRDWNLRGEPLRFSAEGEWRDGKLTWAWDGWFLRGVVSGQELAVEFPSAFIELEGTVEAAGDSWSIGAEGEASVALRLGEYADLLEWDVSVRGGDGEWEGTVDLEGETASGSLGVNFDSEEGRGEIDVGYLSVDLEKVRAWVVVALGPRTMAGWQVTGLPLALSGTGELVPGRFAWDLRGGLESVRVAGPDLTLVAGSVTLDGTGVMVRGEDGWSLPTEARLTAETLSFNDFHLRDLVGRWDGSPWDGEFVYEGTRSPQRLGVIGQYRLWWVEDDWKVEGDTELDLGRPLP